MLYGPQGVAHRQEFEHVRELALKHLAHFMKKAEAEQKAQACLRQVSDGGGADYVTNAEHERRFVACVSKALGQHIDDWEGSRRSFITTAMHSIERPVLRSMAMFAARARLAAECAQQELSSLQREETERDALDRYAERNVQTALTTYEIEAHPGSVWQWLTSAMEPSRD
mgnify:CR=1 FL=1